MMLEIHSKDQFEHRFRASSKCREVEAGPMVAQASAALVRG
jgi:hypothetical protein